MSRIEPDPSCAELLAETQAALALERERTLQLQHLLDHDSDTGLLRRHMIVKRMNRCVHDAGDRFAYGIIRLDRDYQRIRHSRDRLKVLLYVTAERIKAIVGAENLYQSDRVDEFLFYLHEPAENHEIEKTASDILESVRKFHNPPASDISFGCSIGVAVFPDHAATLSELEENAAIALDFQQESPCRGAVYSPEIGEAYHENNTLESILRNGILDGFSGFHVVYQPLVGAERRVIGCEALMRWDAPGHGPISPTRFIPLAEQSGPIVYLGKWILYQVLGQIKIWRRELHPDIFAAINMSIVELEQPDCVETIEAAMNTNALPGEAIQIEVTERVLMENVEAVKKHLLAFQAMGIRISLDDFGTGYSSLAILNTLPIDTLKIAKEIIDNLPADPRSLEIVRAVMSISRSFGFTTLAEGIETECQYSRLVEEGCDVMQGYLFSPPLSAADFRRHYLEFR